MGDEGKGLAQLTREIEYYKRQLDELTSENVKLDYALSVLRHELRQKRQGFALLSGLQQSISVESQLSNIFELTLAAINPILGMDRSAVLVPEGRESHFRPDRWLGFPEEEDARLASLCLEFPAEFSRGTSLLVNGAFPPTPLSESLREALGLPYFICVPIMVDQAPVGLLVSGRNREALPFYPPLDPGDLDTFQAITGMISSSLSIRRLAVLEQMHRLQAEFFANISHEFRTPLMLTLGPLEQVLKGRHGEVPGAVRAQLQLMRRNQQRLLKLINQLLDLARLEAGGMPLKSRAVRDINALIKRRLLPFSALAEKSGVGFRFRPDPRAKDAGLFIDVELFDKLLSNLVSNAFKFTRRGEVEVATEVGEGVLHLHVRDTGIGIRQDQLPHLFTRFRQAEGSDSHQYAGTGIGLSLVKEIAKLHGGEVSVSSEYGKGSTFRVGFPLGAARAGPDVSTEDALEAEPEPAFEEDTEPPDDVEEDREGVRRLNGETEAQLDASKPLLVYAEDNPALREYVRGLLVPHYHVLLAVDGRDALELVRRWQPALVLADHMMPNMSGAELLASLRRDEALRRIPIVLLTARASTEDRLESLESGADDYLMKPFHEGELLVRIRNLVQARTQERELARLHQQLEAKHAELQRAQAELIQSEKMASMGRMTAGISHELKNPLNFIINFAKLNEESTQELSELLESGAAPRPEDVKSMLGALKEGSEQVVKHGQRANDIVHAMLRQVAGGSSGSSQPTDINALLTECATLVSQSHRAQQGAVEVALKLSLDPFMGTLALVPQQLQRVFINLLDNAFDAVRDKARSSGGGYAPQVVVSTRQKKEWVEVLVQDNGPGIPAAIRDRIFEPFFTTKLPGNGTGLGLWMSYDIIVQGFQGMLSVDSTEGAGATFIIMLPRR